MADKITFSKTLNTSVQVGDELWYSNISSGIPTDPTSLGTIVDKGNNWVKINSDPGTTGQIYPDLIINGDFTSTYGSEQYLVTSPINTDGSFTGIPDGTGIDQVTGWNNYGVVTSRTIENEKLVLVTTASNTGAKLTITNAVPFHTYRVTADTSGNTGAGGVYVADIAGGATNQSTDGGVDFYFTATTDSSGAAQYPLIYWRAGDNAPGGGEIHIDNVSVKEVIPTTGWDSQFAAFIGNEAFIQVPAYDPSGATSNHGYIAQSISLVDGETYMVTFDAYGSVSNNIRVQDNHSDIGGLKAADTDTVLTTTPGTTYTFTWEANASSNHIVISRHVASQGSWDFYIDNVVLQQTSFDFATALGGTTPDNLFFMFRKPVAENVSSLKGYYAESTFTNNSTAKQELFAVGSEITISSK